MRTITLELKKPFGSDRLILHGLHGENTESKSTVIFVETTLLTFIKRWEFGSFPITT